MTPDELDAGESWSPDTAPSIHVTRSNDGEKFVFPRGNYNWVTLEREEIRMLAELAGVMPDTAALTAEVQCGNCGDALQTSGFNVGEGSRYAVDAPVCDCQESTEREKVGGPFGSTVTRTVHDPARKHVTITTEGFL